MPTKSMSGKEQYEEALLLAREADRNNGPLPVTLLQEAAKAAYTPAIYALANWYIHGKGVKKNFKKAVSLLKKAASDKYAPAEFDLAASYELGKGVTKNLKAALIWYRRAANGGDLDGQRELAR